MKEKITGKEHLLFWLVCKKLHGKHFKKFKLSHENATWLCMPLYQFISIESSKRIYLLIVPVKIKKEWVFRLVTGGPRLLKTVCEQRSTGFLSQLPWRSRARCGTPRHHLKPRRPLPGSAERFRITDLYLVHFRGISLSPHPFWICSYFFTARLTVLKKLTTSEDNLEFIL